MIVVWHILLGFHIVSASFLYDRWLWVVIPFYPHKVCQCSERLRLLWTKTFMVTSTTWTKKVPAAYIFSEISNLDTIRKKHKWVSYLWVQRSIRKITLKLTVWETQLHLYRHILHNLEILEKFICRSNVLYNSPSKKSL